MFNGEDIVNQLPVILTPLFYQTWNNEFKKCSKCGVEYPKHKLFFKIKNILNDGLNNNCKKCCGDAFINVRIGAVFFELIPDGYKYCGVCKNILPSTKEYFTANKRRPGGLTSTCKKCRGVSEYKVSVSGENAKLSKQGLKKCTYCLKIMPISEYKLIGKTRIAEFCSSCEDRQKDKKREYDQSNYDKRKERKKIIYDIWKKGAGKELRIISHRKRESLKRGLDSNFTQKEWEYCKDIFKNECAYCGREKELTQDHFIPISKGGEYTVNNIVPACLSCNTSKNSSDFFKWYPRYKFYSAQRERKILKYLNYKTPGIQQLSMM